MQDELADRHNTEIDALLYSDIPVEEEIAAPAPVVEDLAPKKDEKKPSKSKLKKQKKLEKMDAIRQKAEEEGDLYLFYFSQ